MNLAGCIKLFTSALIVCAVSGEVEARSMIQHHGRGSAWPAAAPSTAWLSYHRTGHFARGSRFARHQGYSGGGGLQCVTFARNDSGIELVGNANTWWDSAAGIYQRGTMPEPGSVLNFRANRAMRMGHVAVVNEVIDGRTVIIDHANWANRGSVSRGVSVVDVSPGNDWSAVRVGLGHSGDYGSIYPTYGFIYNRPDHGAIMASAETGDAPIPLMNPAPRDLRPRDPAYDEVAEAPDAPYATHQTWHRHHPATLGTRHRSKIRRGS